MSEHTRLRIKFQKTGPIRYIGHLDVMRFFQKCVRRAGIDISYTGGFSPHQIMSFAAPLGVGVESLGEYMDIEVNDSLDSGDAPEGSLEKDLEALDKENRKESRKGGLKESLKDSLEESFKDNPEENKEGTSKETNLRVSDLCYEINHESSSMVSPKDTPVGKKNPSLHITSEELVQRLNEASVPGIRIVSVKKLPDNAENAMASVAAAEYQVTFREGRVPALFQGDAGSIQSAVRDFLALPAIPYLKEGKKGTREIDLRPGIYRLSWEPEKKALTMLLDASSAGNIKPGQVTEALIDRHGQSLVENALKILRLETYTAVEPEGKGERKLIPMDEVGELF